MLLSGGVDSATVLSLIAARRPVRALTFEYHGMAGRELESARAIAARAGVTEHRVGRLPDLKEAGDMGIKFGRRPPTYIPLRNSIFYSFAASYAEECGASLIAGGHNSDDEKVFDDVKQGFFEPLGKAFLAASPVLRKNALQISRPLSDKTKAEVVRLAESIGVPLELTWSCHRTGMNHCWECEGCLGRKKSFAAAGVVDPLAPHGRRKLLKQ